MRMMRLVPFIRQDHDFDGHLLLQLPDMQVRLDDRVLAAGENNDRYLEFGIAR